MEFRCDHPSVRRELVNGSSGKVKGSMSKRNASSEDKKMLDEITSRCLAGPTLRTARVISRSYDRALAGSGITITQLTLLVAIAKYRPGSIAQLCDWLDIEASTLSRNLAKLRNAGLVEKASTEGRALELTLTAEGLSTLRDVYPRWLEVQQGLEERLGAGKVKTVQRNLKDLRKA